MVVSLSPLLSVLHLFSIIIFSRDNFFLFQLSQEEHRAEIMDPYFSEILETIWSTMHKTVCQYLAPVLRNLWQKLTA